MLHLMKYSIIMKVKNFNTLFWPMIFPLILATLFYFAFGQIEEANFDTVPAAIVQDEEKTGGAAKVFLEFLDELGQGDNAPIRAEKMAEQEAKELLAKKEIYGIFYVGDEIALAVGRNGISESILQSILESYENGRQTLEQVAKKHPEGMAAAVSRMSEYAGQVEQVSLGGRTTNGNVIFFYALIGMACLYGVFIGYGAVESLQANLSPLAARRCVAPANRLALILSEMCTSFLLHFGNVMILILYIRYVLKQEFDGSLVQMMPVVLLGCMIGVTIGIFVGSSSKLEEGAKVAILLGVTMGCSFLAGLMSGNMKYIVERYAPLVNRINPAALITDAFYCINVYDDPARYTRNLVILGVITAVLTVISFIKTRRERYDSI